MDLPGLSHLNSIMSSNLQATQNQRELQAMAHQVAKQSQRKMQAVDATILLAEFQQANCASEFAKQLLCQIRRFDENLDTSEEVGMRLVSFGQSVTFHVAEISYYNPSLIVFSGFMDDGRQVELNQHVSQISFLLLALPRLNPEEPKRKIGFVQDDSGLSE